MTPPLPIVLLVIDDNHKSTLIHKALKKDFNLFETQESFSAVDWLKHFHASIIILDEAALTKTWPLFVQHIRTLPDYAKVPILLITNNRKKAFTTQALQLDITDFLLEPLNAEEVSQRVLVHMKNAPISKRVSLLSKKIARTPLHKIAPSFLRRFMVTEEVIRRISQSRKKRFPLTLVMIEIDRFLKLQEEYKPQELHKLLEACISVFKSTLRKNDFLLPQGDGRFLLIFPYTSERAGIAMAQMIRKEIENTSLTAKEARIALSLSMALIAFDTDPAHTIYDQFDAILEKVDRALSKAKSTGNQLITFKRRTP